MACPLKELLFSTASHFIYQPSMERFICTFWTVFSDFNRFFYGINENNFGSIAHQEIKAHTRVEKKEVDVWVRCNMFRKQEADV